MAQCDMPEFFEEHIRVAKKRHRCIECGSAIHIGETYADMSGKWDGVVGSVRQHMRCWHFSRFINFETDLGSDGCIGFGGIGEVINDTGNENLELMWRRVCKGFEYLPTSWDCHVKARVHLQRQVEKDWDLALLQ